MKTILLIIQINKSKMGCTSQREKIESKMLLLKLQRVVIKKQKKENH